MSTKPIPLPLMAVFLGLSMAARAHPDNWPASLQIHGFLGQGLVYSSANQWFGDSEHGSLDFTELGLNASLRPTHNSLIAAQVLSRRAGDMDNGAPDLDFALLDLQLSSSMRHHAGLRLGRIKNRLGLYNDTRDVAATRPSIFLPQSIYFDRVRNLELSSDGAAAYLDYHQGRTGISLTLSTGKLRMDKNVEYSLLGRDWQGELGNKGLVKLAHLLYELDEDRLRLGLTAIDLDMHFSRGPGDAIANGNIGLRYWIASAQYNSERWSVTAEYQNEPLDYDDFGPLLDRNSTVAEGYYLQGVYRFGEDWEALLRYDGAFADKHDHSGRSTSIRLGVPRTAFFAHDWTVGLRWDISPAIMLRAEYHNIYGTFWLSNRENPKPALLDPHWNLYTLLISYRF